MAWYLTLLLTCAHAMNFKTISRRKNINPAIKDNSIPNGIVFYTGGSSVIPWTIYSDFLDTLLSSCKKCNKEVTLYLPDNENEFQTIRQNHENWVVLSHSSSALNALETAQIFDNSTFIMMDPVDKRPLSNLSKESLKFPIIPVDIFSPFSSPDKINIENVSTLCFLTAKKSYEWSIFPFKFPFIPAFGLKPNDFDVQKDTRVFEYTAEKYGHCDILNKNCAQFVSRLGINGNTENELEEYYTWLSQHIIEFIQ